MKKEIETILNSNININKGYRNLSVWKDAVELYKLVKDKIRNLNNIPYKIKAQIEDSMFSVSSNIAEGYCRRSLKENIRFINIALSSMGENYSQIINLINSEDIEIDWFNKYYSLHYSPENRLIRLNKSYILKLRNKEEWKDDYIIHPYGVPSGSYP